MRALGRQLTETSPDRGDLVYTHDTDDRLLTRTDARGITATYSYHLSQGQFSHCSITINAVGRLSEVVSTIGGSPRTLASAVTWRADGRLSGRSFGNGLRETRTYDARGQLRTQQLGAETTTYSYDPAGNLLARSLPGADHGWNYDALDRVIRDRLDTRERSYAYDANHNRTSALVEGTSETYGYVPASNRLTAIATPATSRVLSLDAAGNLTDNGAGQTFTYNQAGRLAGVQTGAGITTYRYNALGLRTHKEGMTNVVFHYDTGGRLLAETTPEGTPIRSYVWFGDEPLAQLDGALDAETPTYLHTDHLATPRMGTDQAGIPVWRWESPAFGDVPPSLQLRTVNLRFPGQYFDQETGLHYNWHRDYDPRVGRYIQSDPVGLEGGINLYGYVDGNPLRFFDPFGLVYGLGDGPYSQFNTVKRATLDTMVPSKSIGEIFGRNCVEICQIDVVISGIAVDIAIGLIPNSTVILVLSKAVATTGSVASTSTSLALCVTECEENEEGCQ